MGKFITLYLPSFVLGTIVALIFIMLVGGHTLPLFSYLIDAIDSNSIEAKIYKVGASETSIIPVETSTSRQTVKL